MSEKRAVVSLNSGSSSIKFALFTLDDAGAPVLAAGGKIERIGTAPHLVARTADGILLLEREWPADRDHSTLLADLFAWGAEALGEHMVIGIGHRVVHGGTEFVAPQRVDDAMLAALDALCPLAPLHQPHNLAAIRAIAALHPDLPQVACFDTAFHHGRSALATRFALPREFHDLGIRRYGFHGLSYEYIAREFARIDPAPAGGRVIVGHLGNGASLCAMYGGRSVDTTMGFTALDGLMMGTRCGTLDAGVVLHLQSRLGMTAGEVEDLLYRRSGLLGVSGISGDMRTLSASDAPAADEAIELFAWRAAREAAGLISSLGGLDGLVFTAGIGENHPDVRARICRRLAWTGVAIEAEANARNAPLISTAESAIAVRVMPTDEERMIALHTVAVLEHAT
jgi:acetate kinase